MILIISKLGAEQYWVNPQFTDFKKPDWKELDLWENREKLLELENRMWNRKTPQKPDDEAWFKRIKKDIAEQSIVLREAWIDIDNNGKIDHILRYDYGRCNPNNQSDFAGASGRTLAIWDDKTNQLDATPKLNKFLIGRHFDVFLYKGRTFLYWFGGKLYFQEGTLSVHDSVNYVGGASELGGTVCAYRYKDRIKERRK